MDRINKEAIREILEQAGQAGLHVSKISLHLHGNLTTWDSPLDKEKVEKKVNRILLSDIKKKSGSIFARVISPKTGKPFKGQYKIKRKTVKPPMPQPPTLPYLDVDKEKPEDTSTEQKTETSNLFVGKAGECAVMSELLFRGYNVNSMLVDDGVDIVASKNNMFYYLQVKTTVIDDRNKIHAKIEQKRFYDYMNTQIRYVIVARCTINKVETNLFFIFDNKNIQRLIFDKKINSNQDRIYIKIEIDPKDNLPYIYDEKRECINFYQNNFDL